MRSGTGSPTRTPYSGGRRRCAPTPVGYYSICDRYVLAERRRATRSPRSKRLPRDRTYLAAIEFEARHRPDPTGKDPSVAKRYAVAKYVLGLLSNKNASQKTAEGIVRGWRELRHYRENVALQRPAALRVKS